MNGRDLQPFGWQPTGWTGRRAATREVIAGPRKILVPVTASNGSRAAFKIALRLAKAWNASITLLHVVNLAIVGEERGIARTRLIDELVGDASNDLRELAARESPDLPVEILVREGTPSRTIINEAARMKADGIVMAAHRHNRWFGWLHRNTARSVLRHATCPVWLLSPVDRRGTMALVVLDPAPKPVPLDRAFCQQN
jgi:nucleotide-binding universal stress UspA family protein